MSNSSDLRPVPQRITVDAEQVRRLVEQQFPRWAGLPVQPVARGGWDNWTFRLGAEMLVRLPSAAEYALAVDAYSVRSSPSTRPAAGLPLRRQEASQAPRAGPA